MVGTNPFDLLGNDDNDDPSQLIARAQQKKAKLAANNAAAKKPAVAAPSAGKLPSKPAPPSQAVREAKTAIATARGGGGRGGFGRGRGGRGGYGDGPNRDFGNNGNMNGFIPGYGGGVEDGEGGKPSERVRGGYGPARQSFRGGRQGGYANGEGEAGDDSERPPRRVYERRSGTGRGYEMKRDGAGPGNWGTAADDVIAQELEEKVNADEKQPDSGDGQPNEGNKDNTANEAEEEKPEDKEMTLEEYEKVREEKRKALLAMKSEERKVDIDKELESMQQLSIKKGNNDIFIKLGSDKESKRRENADREERIKKSLSINEFLKPAEGERYNPGGRGSGRGRGRGRGDRESFGGHFGGGIVNNPAPAIGDPGQFPSLGGGK